MKLKLTYTEGAGSHFTGVFVENADVNVWLSSAEFFHQPSAVKVFPIPGLTANSVCGALLLGNLNIDELPNNITRVYGIGQTLFLTENSSTSPKLSDSAVKNRFSAPHFYHPTYGLIELKEITDWSLFFSLKPTEISILEPEPSVPIIDTIRNYYVREVSPEKALEDLIKKSVPDRSKKPDKPLTPYEKRKLSVLKRFFKDRKKKASDKSNSTKESSDSDKSIGEGAGGSSSIPTKKKSWWKRKQDDLYEQYEDLEERNKRELDKLMDMINEDPDLALKYAIPIDRSGASRGTEGAFRMEQRWSGGRSILGNTGGGGYVNFKDDQTDLLRTKYQQMALNYEQNSQWEKAAFVYLELLSNPRSAVNVLEKGKRYESAAAIHLTKLNDKRSAARCYESGKIYRKAIDLYSELDQQEKVGDLYALMGDQASAKSAYTEELERQKQAHNFKNAARISNEKLNDLPQARSLWRKGWEGSPDDDQCLESLLDSYSIKQRKREISNLHEQEFSGRRMHTFLDVLFKQTKKDESFQPDLEKVLYESVARNAESDPDISDYLKKWKKSPLVTKDVFRFKRFGKRD